MKDIVYQCLAENGRNKSAFPYQKGATQDEKI